MKQLRYILEALLLGFILLLSKSIPVTWASGFGGWVGRTIGPRLAASRKAHANATAAFPHKSKLEIDKIIKDMWDNLGRVMMEYAHLPHIGRDRTEIIGTEILKQYQDKPAILFSAHLANWEVCPIAAMTQENFKVSSVYRAPNNPFSNKMLHNARSLKNTLHTIRKSKTGTRHLVKALNENAHIGILIDQKYNEGIAADFFGRAAMTSPAFVQLAQKYNCPLIPLKIERISGPNFKMTILPPLEIQNKSVEDVVDESHALLEEWITAQPSQWLWLHRRWETLKLKE